ncbi:hypothetical protein [Actinomadura parmotrematis]|uniref:HEAT repeat domain-containing protein n=1 Tax=Actinomadura parmotrematis TaxID=2864039 RepID=A0ABS7FL22_9ACTN|nr:hypothetical protein [Actinomadura parmotrematis]MBW8481068.1 hypothetical protein [Actinomadura parmotrematis]
MREAAGTLHGQLQRGLGRAARRAADRPGAGEYVYDCVRRDPRWDVRCESRSLYYARLMVDLELPVGPVADHLFAPADATDEDDGRVALALGVLGDLVRLSRREAGAVLREYAEDGMHWFDALYALAWAGDASLTGGLEDLVTAYCDDSALAFLVAGPRNPVIDGWAARQPRIAEAARRHRERERPPRPAARAAERSEPDLAELLALARGRDDAAMSAIFELGRRRSPELLDLAVPLAAGEARWRSVLRKALGLYGADALPRARTWVAGGGALAELGREVIAAHGTRADIPVLMDTLNRALDDRDWHRAADPIAGLGRLRAGEAVPLLKAAWTETPYSYLRPRVLAALTRTAPHTAETFCTEALWDCEEEARLVAARSAPLTEDTSVRLQRLEHDAAETPGVRAAAGARPV